MCRLQERRWKGASIRMLGKADLIQVYGVFW